MSEEQTASEEERAAEEQTSEPTEPTAADAEGGEEEAKEIPIVDES